MERTEGQREAEKMAAQSKQFCARQVSTPTISFSPAVLSLLTFFTNSLSLLAFDMIKKRKTCRGMGRVGKTRNRKKH